MKISIIICTYNKIRHLLLTLYSFCFSDFVFNDFEVIVCDDGSTIPMEELYDLQLPFAFKILSLPHGGRAKARNAGIAVSSGEVIVFNDDDSVITPDFLTRHWRCHQDTQQCIILGQRRQVYLNSNELGLITKGNLEKLLPIWFDCSREDIYTAQTRKLIFSNNRSKHWLCATTANMSVKSVWLDKYGVFDEVFTGWGFEDIELAYRMAKSEIHFYYNSSIINYHIEHFRNREKMIEEMQSNILYFYHKYGEPEDIRYFWEFFRGNISLDQFDHHTCNEISADIESIYFTLFKRAKLKSLQDLI